jgi:hypothetical protein
MYIRVGVRWRSLPGKISDQIPGAVVLYTLRAQTHTNFHQTTNPYPYQSQAAAPQLPVPILGKGTKTVRKDDQGTLDFSIYLRLGGIPEQILKTLLL